jgi:AsmA protein
MPKALKWTLAAAGGLLALLLAAVLVIALTFDPNSYKPQLADLVRQQYQRTLAVPGPISLTFLPRLGVKVGEVTLSERNSTERFAALNSAQVSLALWPLLRKQVVVDRLAVTGLNARIVRGKDGKLNIDDLIGGGNAAAAQPAPPAAPASAAAFELDIAGVALADATLAYEDQQAQRRVQLSKLSLQTGRFKPGTPTPLSLKARLDADSPRLGSDVALQASVQLGPEPGRLAVQALQLDLEGALGAPGTLALKARLAGALEGHTGDERYAATAFTLTLDARQGSTPITAKLQAPWKADLKAGAIEVPKLDLEAQLPNPKDAKAAALPLTATGSLAVKTGSTPRLDAKLAGQFDASRFTLSFGMPRFSPAAYTFEVELDRLDADRYRAAAPAAAATAASAPAAEKPLDLTALRDLEASGQLRIGALQVLNLKASQVRTAVRATGGRLTVGPLAAQLYEGQLGGSVGITATSPPRLSLQPSVSGVAIGPLLKDLAGFDRLLGRGNVALDLTGSGATTGAITKSLAGNARVELRDGAVRGINIAQAIRTAKAAAKGGGAGGGLGTAARDQATDFSELTASFKVAGGVARNDDLALKSPLMRIGGAGDIDLAASRLDYTVKATVVSTLKGQGGAELDALRGQTIPVKLSGPLDAIAWRIDFGGMLREAAQGKLDEKKEELKDDAKRRLGDKLRGLIKKP